MAEVNEPETKDAPLQSEEQQTTEEGKDTNDLHPRIQQLTKKMYELEESKDTEISSNTPSILITDLSTNCSSVGVYRRLGSLNVPWFVFS